MLVSRLLKTLLFPFLFSVAPEGGGADRGDDFTPLPDEDDTVVAEKPDETKPDDKKVEAKADEDDEDDEDDKKKDEERKPRIRIPKERLDQEIAKRRAAEQRFAEREAQLVAQIQQQKKDANVEALESDLAKLDEQYDDAIADGEKAKAREIKTRMRELERKLSRAEAIQASIQSKQAAVAEIRYDMAVSQVEMDYPEVNPDNEEEFDADKAAEVMDMLDAFKLKGVQPDVALRRAVRYVLGPPKRLVEKVEVGPDPEKDGLRRRETKEDRTVEARKRAADAVNRQPANTSKVGLDTDKLGGGKPTADAVARMTQEQFLKLDEDTKARLRGDEL